jgi:hypothetical protein
MLQQHLFPQGAFIRFLEETAVTTTAANVKGGERNGKNNDPLARQPEWAVIIRPC